MSLKYNRLTIFGSYLRFLFIKKYFKKIILGASGLRIRGYLQTEENYFNIENSNDWQTYFNQDSLKEIIKGNETRLVGPNCVGTYDSSTFADSIFLPRDKLTRPKKGGISVISQSGAVGSILLDYMASQNLGVSKFISYGNAADVNETDLIEFLSKDKFTEVIVCYIEGVRDGKNFIKVCKKCRKPIIVLKGGTSEKTARAVSSHTGSMAGSGEVYAGGY